MKPIQYCQFILGPRVYYKIDYGWRGGAENRWFRFLIIESLVCSALGRRGTVE